MYRSKKKSLGEKVKVKGKSRLMGKWLSKTRLKVFDWKSHPLFVL